MKNRLLLIFALLLLISCDSIIPSAKFDRKRWDEKEDWDYPYRNEMADDLVKHHKLKGLTYKQLIDSLGGAEENMTDKNGVKDGVYYQLLMDFGSDIDPVHTRYLVIKLSKDSIVTGYKIEEWKKE